MAPPSKRQAIMPVVLEYLRQGAGQDRAASLAGVNRFTLRRWMQASPSVRRRVARARHLGEQVAMNRATLAWAESHATFMERAAAVQRRRQGVSS
jgi:hypothetical protein